MLQYVSKTPVFCQIWMRFGRAGFETERVLKESFEFMLLKTKSQIQCKI
jgi:hypothetical protein